MESSMCPRDSGDLQQTEIKHENVIVIVDACPSCKGVWFDRGELGLLTNPRVELVLQTLHSGKDSITRCPRCRSQLVISTFRDVRADVCTRCCGVWLNRAEYYALTRDHTTSAEPKERASTRDGPALEVHATSIPPASDLLVSVEDGFASLGIAAGSVLAGSGPLLEAELLVPGEAGAQGASLIGPCQLVSLQGKATRNHERLSLILHAVLVDSHGMLRAGTLIRARTRGSVELIVAGEVRKSGAP